MTATNEIQTNNSGVAVFPKGRHPRALRATKEGLDHGQVQVELDKKESKKPKAAKKSKPKKKANKEVVKTSKKESKKE